MRLFDVPATDRPEAATRTKRAKTQRTGERPLAARPSPGPTGRWFRSLQAIPRIGGSLPPGTELELWGPVVDGRGNFQTRDRRGVSQLPLEQLTEL